MSIFKITINAGPPAKFNPNPQLIAANDSVFWFNADQTQPHWPAPSKSNPTGFMSYQIPPNSQSSLAGFGNPGTVNYICVLHDGESGQINVVTPKAVSFGKKTKKGGFGTMTKKGSFAAKTKSTYGAKTKKSPFAAKTKSTFGAKTKKNPFGSTTKK
jgi:hypothetical protein